MNFDNQQAENLVTESIAEIVVNNRKGVVKILRKNGIDVSEEIDDKELLTAIYTALSASTAFAVDLKKLLYSEAKESYENTEDYENLAGVYIDPKLGTAISNRAKAGANTGKPKKQGAFGNFLKGVFTPETVGALVNTGVNAVSKKLTAKEDAAMLDRAIALKVNETEASIAKQGLTEKKNKWIVPAIVVGGLVVVATVAIIIYRKRKK